MKIKRHKKFQRHMAFYVKNFQFRTPYQILIDGTFGQAVLYNKINMKDQLPKYLGGHVKLLTTVCVQAEAETLGPDVYGALQILKQTPIHKCSHMESPVPAATCLISMVKNTSGYIVATQDTNLKVELRKIAGVPLMFLQGTAPTMERPSDVSVESAEKITLDKMQVLGYRKEILDHYKDEEIVPAVKAPKGTRKRKRAGPNPLSVKKSKKIKPFPRLRNPDLQEQKRRRIRVKVAKHVRDVKFNPKPSS